MSEQILNVLAIRENVKHELTQLKTIEDGLVHLNKLKGIEAWVKAQKMDAEIHAAVLEQELRTKRIVGILLRDGKESGEVAVRGGDAGKSKINVPRGNIETKTLDELGLTRKQSASFQKIANIPEEVFEAHIADAKAELETAVNKLTTTGALKLAEEIEKKGKTYAEQNRAQGYFGNETSQYLRAFAHDKYDGKTARALRFITKDFFAKMPDDEKRRMVRNYMRDLKLGEAREVRDSGKK